VLKEPDDYHNRHSLTASSYFLIRWAIFSQLNRFSEGGAPALDADSSPFALEVLLKENDDHHNRHSLTPSSHFLIR
jgi:hypothetical protein